MSDLTSLEVRNLVWEIIRESPDPDGEFFGGSTVEAFDDGLAIAYAVERGARTHKEYHDFYGQECFLDG